jgi:predicted small metal-binding protein
MIFKKIEYFFKIGGSDMQTNQKRVFIDCREHPSESNCSLRISGTEQEVMEIAVEHAISKHRHQKSSELTEMIRKALKEEKSV